MSEVKQLPQRSEIPAEQTWDLTPIFTSDDEFEKALASVKKKAGTGPDYQGTLKNGAEALLRALEEMLEIFREAEKIYVYSHLKNDQDTANPKYQAYHSQASALLDLVSARFSWFEPELLSLSDEEIEKDFAENKKLAGYRHYLDSIRAKKAHILPAAQEELLAGAGEIFSASSKTFSVLNNADLKFPVVENEKGQKVQLSHGLYGQLLESSDREVRRQAFQGLYSVYDQFQNTFATTLVSHTKMHNYLAKVRHYASAREMSLAANQIPEAVYDMLVGQVNDHLALLHRYVALRKTLLGVDELHMYDMYTPLLGEAPIKFSFEEAKATALKALAPLGEDYLQHVEEAFESRWIDVVENQGKRSGAYSSGMYDTNPYILLNWHDSLDQLYTLVHEMGHSMHSWYTRHNQPYVYGDYSIFLAEIASTTNENLLTEYLLATEKDPKVQAYVLNHYLDGFKGTIFRQTQFAEFELHIHQKDQAGAALTAEALNQYYGELNARYYGKDAARDPEIALEWSRIPHFYYNFYVYQYATGFAAASALAKRIHTKTPQALEQYLTYLRAGNSQYPIQVMQKAGVDMTQPEYLTDAFKQFEKRLEMLEKLVESRS
ncbi:MAG: oligoendopeptidase F [Enterococcaceae bacterium]|jgi:oligoendopeptidase F|nr:oligoendopeptidase F [Enterococcaceae bacterium]MCI1920173.1 oligoendopeptidase F [Enterococcaceae bacterium]